MNILKKLFSKPQVVTLTITSNNGFHLRPVAEFVTLAKTFSSTVLATHKGVTVDAKSVTKLLSLGLEGFNIFTLTINGSDSTRAKESLTTLFYKLMQDDPEPIQIQKHAHTYKGIIIEADSIYSGIVIAPLYAYKKTEKYTPNSQTFSEAISFVIAELEHISQSVQNSNSNIYIAQKELLISVSQDSKSLTEFEKSIHKEINVLRGTSHQTKEVDYLDILKRVKHHLGYNTTLSLPDIPSILVAEDLLPSDINLLENSTIKGVILTNTSPTSHTAILLNAAGIVSLITSEPIIVSEELVVLDAHSGVFIPYPIEDDIAKASQKQKKIKDSLAQSYTRRFEPAYTKNNKRVHLLANVSDISSVSLAKEEGAEGIGLLRTEFLFKTKKPTIEEQVQTYKSIFSLFPNTTVRTLDIGGDKELPYINLPHENNPFLGIRGIRLLQTHPEIIEEQLYAIFIASKSQQIKIMFPMIATVEEFVQAKNFSLLLAKKHDIDVSHIDFGIMVEIPAVLYNIKAFNNVVDFYSIGTNDLTQYLFAIERTHPTLKVDPLSPIVFSALKQLVTQASKPVSICGELASNKDAIASLINLGINTLSVSPKSIPQTKEIIRHV